MRLLAQEFWKVWPSKCFPSHPSFSGTFLVMATSHGPPGTHAAPEGTCQWARLGLEGAAQLTACSSRHWGWIPLQCQGLKHVVTLCAPFVSKPQRSISKTGMAFVCRPLMPSSTQRHTSASPQLGPRGSTGIDVLLVVFFTCHVASMCLSKWKDKPHRLPLSMKQSRCPAQFFPLQMHSESRVPDFGLSPYVFA